MSTANCNEFYLKQVLCAPLKAFKILENTKVLHTVTVLIKSSPYLNILCNFYGLAEYSEID